jgi:hypothetical protein
LANTVDPQKRGSIFVRCCGDLIEKREKLMQKIASVPVSFMQKGFAVVLPLGCYPMRLQYWQRTEVTGLFTAAYMGMAPAFGYFGMATRSSCRCPELSTCL